MKYLAVIFLLLFWMTGQAQSTSIRNFNIYNGLPSNHVYNSIVDHNGYLWLATPKGVVKYNGYEFKIFGYGDGLPNEDVWYLLEDSTGRIWLGSIANALGYIYNDKYYHFKLIDSQNTLYPKGIGLYKKGITFTTSYLYGSAIKHFYLINNDSITQVTIPNSIFSDVQLTREDSLQYVQDGLIQWQKNAFLEHDSMMYTIITNKIYNILISNNTPRLLSNTKISSRIGTQAFVTSFLVFNNFYIYKLPGENGKVYSVNRKSGSLVELDVNMYKSNEKITYLHFKYPSDRLYLFTTNYLFEFLVRDSIKLISQQKLSNWFHDQSLNGQEIVSVLKNDFWGTVFTSKNNGVQILSQYKNYYLNQDLNLKGFDAVGSLSDSVTFWWNSSTYELSIIEKDMRQKSVYLKTAASIKSVIKLGTDTFLAMGPTNYIITPDRVSGINSNFLATGVAHAFRTKQSNIIAVSNSGFTISDLTGKGYVIDANKYENMSANTKSDEYWAYTKSQVCIYNAKERKSIIVDNRIFKKQGINIIEQIAVDTVFQNVFIHDNNHLVYFDKNTLKIKPTKQLDGVNLKGCEIYTYRDKLIVAGKIGVIILKICGKDSLGKAWIVPNISNFRFLNNLQIFAGNVILNTDNGVYCVSILDSSLNKYRDLNSIIKNYKIICKCGDKIYNIKYGDSIVLDQNLRQIQFDIINPNGNGVVSYEYSSDQIQAKSSSNYFNLPYLEPDRYFSIRVRAYDDTWQSDVHTIVIYIKPYWYQTQSMKRIIWVGMVVGLILLIISIILITHRQVSRANQKRNARMELELKSVYAQINPHFIFNSLNSALLLVSKGKTDDAYVHISKFSRLLRSYIKSSRNKMILLSDEIKNLTNYIDLQQVRFKDKFSYSIVVGSEVNPDNIHIPSLLLQPFVENAIEHGLLNKTDTGNLTISFNRGNNDTLICVIEDDGIGRKESKQNKIPNPTKDESYGELLIKDLVSIFNRYEKMNINVSYADKTHPMTGTVVTILINLREQKN